MKRYQKLSIVALLLGIVAVLRFDDGCRWFGSGNTNRAASSNPHNASTEEVLAQYRAAPVGWVAGRMMGVDSRQIIEQIASPPAVPRLRSSGRPVLLRR